MWKERQNDQLVETPVLDGPHGVGKEGIPRTHANKCLYVSPTFLQFVGKRARLFFSQFPQWGSATDLPVVTLGRLSPKGRDRISDQFSERRPLHMNDLGVGE